MEKVIDDLSKASELIIVVALVVLVLAANILFFTKLLALRKMSKRFMANSKKENFESGLKLFQVSRSLFAFVVFLDLAIVFFSGNFRIPQEFIYAVLIVFSFLHLGFGIPIIRYGSKAASRYRHLYPPVPKAESPHTKAAADVPDEKADVVFFEEAQLEARTAAPKIQTPPEEDTEEIIKYDDEGYIGAWRVDKGENNPNGQEPQGEAIPAKECPFCGTPNNINNKECDFCGADITDIAE